VDTHGRWPWVAAAALVPAWGLAAARRDWLARDGRWVAWLAFPLLATHQTEEWVRPGGFLEFANERLLDSGEPAWPLTGRVGFHVNVTAGWGTAVGGALLWRRSAAPAALVLGIEAGNVLMHTGMALRERGYNPGVATAVLLFAPHVAAGARWLGRSGRLTRRSAAFAAAGALGFSAGLPAALTLRMRRRGRGPA